MLAFRSQERPYPLPSLARVVGVIYFVTPLSFDLAFLFCGRVPGEGRIRPVEFEEDECHLHVVIGFPLALQEVQFGIVVKALACIACVERPARRR